MQSTLKHLEFLQVLQQLIPARANGFALYKIISLSSYSRIFAPRLLQHGSHHESAGHSAPSTHSDVVIENRADGFDSHRKEKTPIGCELNRTVLYVSVSYMLFSVKRIQLII
jgi:hypothetical protein